MIFLENIIWTYVTIPLLFFVSIFFTISKKGPQFRLKEMLKHLQKKETNSKLTPMGTLFIALSARMGVGTLAGVGLAIAIGGPGAIFWMWISAILTSATTFAENTLAQRFKRKQHENYCGGPAFYMKYGLKNKKIAALYAIMLILTYTLGFVAVQMNTMTTIFSQNSTISPIIIGVILTAITAVVITGSLEKISLFIAKIIPFIAIIFFGLATVSLLFNLPYVPTFFTEIFTDAFGITSVTGGGIGVALTTGVKRGIFSNEAGLGTGAHAAALIHHENPREQGYLGIIGIYLATLISMTLVAFMIMSSGAHQVITTSGNGIEFLQFSLTQRFGPVASVILPVIVFIFGFSTVVTAYLFGLMNVKFLSKKQIFAKMLQWILLIVVFVASISQGQNVWRMVDIGVGLMSIINVMAIFMLRNEV